MMKELTGTALNTLTLSVVVVLLSLIKELSAVGAVSGRKT
jgi:hypothetical protein